MTILTNKRIKRLIQFCEKKPQIDCGFFSINSLNLFDRIIRIRSLVRSRVIRAIHNKDLAILDEYFSIDLVHSLIKEREDILSICIRSRRFKILNHLLQQTTFKGDARSKSDHYMVLAIKSGDIDIVRLFLNISIIKMGAHKWANNWLRKAILHNMEDIALLFLKLENVRRTVHRYNNYILKQAIINGMYDLTSELLQINHVTSHQSLSQGLYLTASAIGKQRTDIAMLLLKRFEVRQNVAAMNNYLLRFAFKNDSLYIANHLIQVPKVRERLYKLEQFILKNVWKNDPLLQTDVLIKSAHNNLIAMMRGLLRTQTMHQLIDDDQTCLLLIEKLMTQKFPFAGFIVLVDEVPKILRYIQVDSSLAQKRLLENFHKKVKQAHDQSFKIQSYFISRVPENIFHKICNYAGLFFPKRAGAHCNDHSLCLKAIGLKKCDNSASFRLT